ncbi:transcription factor TFIIIB component B'' homolog, partial [Sinocyclocheilus grahami]|uniref:transcription factor TFIIIB component B'' homolog n=1 Tax=Sinocyclocheilus grahami TaxID=75366 RepID=UPI0007AD14F0
IIVLSVTSGPPRRKRVTALPNLAKPRASSRTPKSPSKSPVKPVTPSEPENSTPTEESSLQIPEPVSNPRLPGRRRPSGGGRQAKVQPIPAAPLQNDQETETQKDGGLEDTLVPLTVQQRLHYHENAAVDEPEESENLTSDDSRFKSPAIKPAQLKGRPQRAIPNLSHRWGSRHPVPRGNVQEDRTSAREGCKVDKSPKAIKEKKHCAVLLELEDLEEEPDLSAVQEQIFNKPTRSGRIPKLSQHVIQAAEEEDEEELSDLPVSSKFHGQDIKAPGRRAKLKPGPRLKQGMPRRGKSRLVTLLASGTEDDDEEEGEVSVLSQEDFPSNPEEENQAFVPMSLRPLPPVNSEVVETMEELDISVNVSDILGTYQNALCPELSCEQATVPASPVPCEHQLDLLVDVIEFLDPDHMEVCREINNEAAETLLTIGNSAQMIQTSEMPCTIGNDIIEQSSIVHEEVVHEEVITETADVEFSSYEAFIPEPSAEETPTQNKEPIKSQTTEDHPCPIQHETQVPPSKRGRFSKPNIGQDLRTRQQQTCPELVTGSFGTSMGPSSTEQDRNAAEPMQEDCVPVDHLPDFSTVHPEVLQPDPSSERREDRPKVIPERVNKEDNRSVSSLKRKNDDIITEENIKEQEGARLEPQLTKSVSESQSTSDEPSKPVRRCRGPKPKPNLIQTSRRTQTTTVLNQKQPAAEWSTNTFTKSPEEGAVVTTELDVFTSTAQHVVTSSIESAQTVKDVTLPVVSENKSRQKTVVMLDENNRTNPEDVFEDSTLNRSGCESEDTSAEPTPEEPVFILSLTEIPPTLDEGADFRTEPLPPAAAPESHSHGQSASESREASHLLITDALVPVSEDEEKKSEWMGVGKSVKGELKCKTPASTSQGSTIDESRAEHHVVEGLESLVAEGTDDKEHLEKKRKLPDSTRRAKLPVKPIPVSRRNAQGVDAKEDTAALSLKQTTSLPISTQETRSVPEQTVPAVISSTNNSISATISDRGAITDHSATSDNTRSPVPEASVQDGPSQGIMGKVDLSGKETVELASGSDLQGVSQITPIATSGPLTR